jgi:hypothetical protein
MRFFFIVILAACLFAAVTELPLTHDGSYYLVKSLDNMNPNSSHNRFVNKPIEFPAVAAFALTKDVNLAVMLFSMAYALILFVSLAAAWYIIRERAPYLMVWAALGTFSQLPGIFVMQFEAVFVVHLFWPVLFAILVKPDRVGVIIAALFALAISVAHPFAVPEFVIAAGVVAVMHFLLPAQQRAPKLLIPIFLVLAAASAVVLIFNAPYSPGDVTADGLIGRFRTSLDGLPLPALIALFIGGLLILLVPRITNQQRQALANRVAISLLVISGAMLTVWASVPNLWRNAGEYRAVTVFAAMPFMFAAVADYVWAVRGGQGAHAIRNTGTTRRSAMRVSALAYLIVVVLQGSAWSGMVNNLRSAVQQATKPCILANDLPALHRTVMDWWTMTSYSLLVQDYTPEVIVVDSRVGRCPTDFSEGFPISPFLFRRWETGFFDMSHLRRNLEAVAQQGS